MLSFELASSSPCFTSCYGNEEGIIKPLNINEIHQYVPELGLMSLLPSLLRSFPEFPLSGRDISSQYKVPVNPPINEKKESWHSNKDIPFEDQPCAGLDSIAELETSWER